MVKDDEGLTVNGKLCHIVGAATLEAQSPLDSGNVEQRGVNDQRF